MPNIPEEYLNVNQRAQVTFSNLKRKMKLDIGIPLIEKAIKEGTNSIVKVDREKIEALLEGTIKAIPELEQYKSVVQPTKAYKELEEVAAEINETFAWIDSLELDPKLSLAIGLVISYKNTKNTDDLKKAIEALMTEGKFEKIKN